LLRAYRDLLGLGELYIADLDAISGEPPDVVLYRQLAGQGVRLWIDAGLRDPDNLAAILDLDRADIVVGIETAAGPDAVAAILDRTDPGRVVISLDLFDGVARLPGEADWAATDPEGLSRQVLDMGVRRLILLDLARVGTGRGTGTRELLSLLRATFPAAEISVGGGIAGIEELIDMQVAGASGVLVGSALHDGRIGREELDRLVERG
jgi:phosphoribosylformimino-5-aminoimidazole carboxamide ribotide isomerase